MLKIPWKHKSFVELPTLSIDKLRQNPEYLCKKAPLLPTPCSPTVLVENETALPSEGGRKGDSGGNKTRKSPRIGGFRGRKRGDLGGGNAVNIS